jgi:hypothetical protein
MGFSLRLLEAETFESFDLQSEEGSIASACDKDSALCLVATASPAMSGKLLS